MLRHPSPTPGLLGGPFRSPRPQQQTDLRGAPRPLGHRPAPQTPRMHARPQAVPPWGGRPADSQTPPFHLTQAGVPLAQGQLLSHPLSSVHPPSCQRTHSSPVPGDRPWVAVPPALSLAPAPKSMSSSCDCGVIWCETNQPNSIYAIPVCLSVSLARPSEARLGRPVGQGQSAAAPSRASLCPGGWPCRCLFLVF